MLFINQVEIFSCLLMTGLIWMVQLVHYPSFLYVDQRRFQEFSKFHQTKISLIVIPVMCVEALSHSLNYLMGDLNTLTVLDYLSTLSLVLIWSVTFFISVPCHRILSERYDERVIRKLVNTNWLRTFFWSLRSLLFLVNFGNS